MSQTQRTHSTVHCIRYLAIKEPLKLEAAVTTVHAASNVMQQSLNFCCETFSQCVYDFSYLFFWAVCLWHNALNIWPQKSNKSIPESESETVRQIKKSISVQAQLRYSVQQNGLNVGSRWLQPLTVKSGQFVPTDPPKSFQNSIPEVF